MRPVSACEQRASRACARLASRKPQSPRESGNSTDDILSGQYRCHVAATLTGRLPSHGIIGVNRFSTASLQFTRVIPEIDIWRAANLMLKRYGEKVLDESGTLAHELAADGDHDGASTWRRNYGPPSSSSLTTYRP